MTNHRVAPSRRSSFSVLVGFVVLAVLMGLQPQVAYSATELAEVTPCTGQATIMGTVSGDIITGTPGDDIIEAGNGDDVIDGAGGNDMVCGGNGQDTLTGGAGNDRLYGGNALDLLDGGAGDDQLWGGNAKDDLRGGPGRDALDGGEAPDTCSGGESLTSCEVTVAEPTYPYEQEFEGPMGTKVVVRSASTPIDVWDLRIRPDLDASQLAGSMQASYAFDFHVMDPNLVVSEAEITIPYAQAALQGYDPTRLRIHHLDDVTGLWHEASQIQSVDTVNHTVTVKVNHFSTYTVMKLPDDGFASYWDTIPVWCVPPDAGTASNLDVAFTIDTSGSMWTYDPDGLRVDGAKAFLAAMKDADRAAVVDFDSWATVTQPLVELTPANRTAVENALEATRDASGGTDITAAVRTATNELRSKATDGRPRIALLITDGESSYDFAATQEAADAQVVFYTIALGDAADAGLLRSIAEGTGGRFLGRANASELPALYEELSQDLIDPMTDTDGDGLTDCVERRGMLVSQGFYAPDAPGFASDRFVTTDWQNPDSDWDSDDEENRDGLDDGEEMGAVIDLRSDPLIASQYAFLIDAGLVRFWYPRSDPNNHDGDREQLRDDLEHSYSTNAFKIDTDNDTATDYEEVQLGLDPTGPDGYVDGAEIPGLHPSTLFVPTTDNSPFNWPYLRLQWDPETGLCDAPCGEIYDYVRDIYNNDKGWFCKLVATCSIDDIEREVIRQVVAAQGMFKENGYLTEEIVADTLVTGCVAQAADFSECTSDRVEEVADDDWHSYEMVEAVVTILSMLPGGARPPNSRIDTAKARLQQLASKACADTTKLTGETATAWGTRVHQRFDELVRAENNPEFFGETGYLGGSIVNKNGSVWPGGTTAPDAVFGTSRLQPEAFFDLKTGAKGIEGWWVERLAGNIRGLLSPDQVINIFMLTC